MTIALITTNPQAILGVFPDGTTRFNLPSGDIVDGASVGWTGEGCAVVDVVSFVTPSGRGNVGTPSYAFDANGNVVETFATQAILTPIPTAQVWQIKAILSATQTAAVENAIAASPEAATLQAFWSTGDAPIPSNSTTLIALGAAIGLTADQVANLVQTAATVSIP